MKRIIPLQTTQVKTITRKTETTRGTPLSSSNFSFIFSPILSMLLRLVFEYTFEGG